MGATGRDVTFSCITPTFRYGGIDVLVNGLAHQTDDDFECILVDELYHERKGAVADYVAEKGLAERFVHVPPKRRDADKPVGLGNARNTGLMLAEGEYVVTLDDYTFLAPDCLGRFRRMHAEYGDHVVLAIRRVYDNPPVERPEGDVSTYAEEFDGVAGLDYELHDIYQENVGVLPVDIFKFVLGLGSIPLEAMLAVEGYDERFDNGHGVENADLLYRLSRVGLDRYMDTGNINAHVDHPTQPMLGTSDNVPLFKERQARGESTATNPFDLREKRQELLAHKAAIARGEEPREAPLKWDEDADFYRP